MQLCAFGKLVREHLRAVCARPRFVRLCRREADNGLELPGGPRARAEDISHGGSARGAAP